MTSEFKKCGYYLPPNLIEVWQKFHAPSKNYSPAVAAAMLMYLAANPTLRARFRDLVFETPAETMITTAQKVFRDLTLSAWLTAYIDGLPESQKIHILEDAIRSERKLSGKK